MALEIGPWKGESLPLVIPVTNSRTGQPITNPMEVRIWVEKPDGTILADKTLTEGEIDHLGEDEPDQAGRFRGVFVPDASGVHTARSTVTGPDGLTKSSRLIFEIHKL